VILVDTGPLVATGAADDRHHQVCTELLSSATEELLVPATVSAEVCYLLEKRAGSRAKRRSCGCSRRASCRRGVRTTAISHTFRLGARNTTSTLCPLSR
jgi:predicted nucleic acid-binding protein